MLSYFREMFSQFVASEYLKLFNFKNQSLLTSFRRFVSKFVFTGESQLIDRIIKRFSDYYHKVNPQEYGDRDTVHALLTGLLLLNSDLHNPVSSQL